MWKPMGVHVCVHTHFSPGQLPNSYVIIGATVINFNITKTTTVAS